MEIRRLLAADAPALRALRLRAFQEHPEAFVTSHAEATAEPLAATVQRLARPGVSFWGAFEGGELCGQAGLEREQREKARHKARLVGMYVAPGHRQGGLGRRLVEAVLAQAREDGVELVVLTVTEGNAGAIALYERCGFRGFGVEPQAIKVDGLAYGKVHMACLLTSPSAGRSAP